MKCFALALLACLPARAADAPKLPAGFKLLYEQDFTQPDALKDLVFSDAKAWRLVQDDGRGSLELFGKSDYKPAHRSPLTIALLAGKVFGGFVLEVELLSTVKPNGPQDMCLCLVPRSFRWKGRSWDRFGGGHPGGISPFAR